MPRNPGAPPARWPGDGAGFVLVNSLIRRPGGIAPALPWSGLSGPRASRLPDLWPGKTASATDPLSLDRRALEPSLPEMADEAIAACKRIVDECLEAMLLPGMTATALYEQYEGFGDDPFVMPVDPNDAPVAFSACAYAKERCQVLGRTPLVFPADWEDVTADQAGAVISIVGVKPPKSD